MLDTAGTGAAVLGALLSRVRKTTPNHPCRWFGVVLCPGCSGDSCVAMETTYRYTGLLIVHSSTRSGYRGLSDCPTVIRHPRKTRNDTHNLRLSASGMRLGFRRMGVWRAYCSSILTPPHPFRVPGQEPSCRVGLSRNTRVSGLVCGYVAGGVKLAPAGTPFAGASFEKVTSSGGLGLHRASWLLVVDVLGLLVRRVVRR